MAVEVIEKKKRGLTCAECGTSVSADAEECPECGSSDIKKSLVIVRKSVADTDDELDAVDDTEVEEDDDLEEDDDEEDDEEEEDEEEEDDDEDDDDEEEDDDDEEDDEEEEEEPQVKKSLVAVEALNIGTAFAQDVAKVFGGKKVSRAKYEAVMTEFNNVMDSAADQWFAGEPVMKSKKIKHDEIIRERVDGILSEGNSKVKKSAKSTSISKRADLPEDVRKSLEAADKIVEEREQEKWLGIAKGYQHFTGEPEELAKTLRTLSEASPEAFTALKTTLDAAEENLSQSEVFKSYGAPGGGSTEIVKNAAKEEQISKVMQENPGMTREMAEVEIMDGSAYKATA